MCRLCRAEEETMHVSERHCDTILQLGVRVNLGLKNVRWVWRSDALIQKRRAGEE